MIDVTVIIHTLNEEINLPFCLDSVYGKFSQILLVDSESSDRTIDIATEKGVDIISRKCTRATLVDQRNWALETGPIRNSWVFILDADEVIPSDLYEEICECVRENDPNIDGYWVNYKEYFLGRWIKYAALYPNWNMRLFRHGKVFYEKRGVNAHIDIDKKRAGWMKTHFIHYDRNGFKTNLKRLWDINILEMSVLAESKESGREKLKPNLFSSSSVERRLAFKKLFHKVPFKPLIMFFYLYVIRLGFIEGRVGYYHAWYRAINYYVMDVFAYEKELLRKDLSELQTKSKRK